MSGVGRDGQLVLISVLGDEESRRFSARWRATGNAVENLQPPSVPV